MVIVAKVDNSSSSDVTPKFSLIRDIVYHANGRTKHENTVCQKVSDNCIKSKTQKEIRCDMKIPVDQMMTVQNCDILSVEYHLKVQPFYLCEKLYLDLCMTAICNDFIKSSLYHQRLFCSGCGCKMFSCCCSTLKLSIVYNATDFTYIFHSRRCIWTSVLLLTQRFCAQWSFYLLAWLLAIKVI